MFCTVMVQFKKKKKKGRKEKEESTLAIMGYNLYIHQSKLEKMQRIQKILNP